MILGFQHYSPLRGRGATNKETDRNLLVKSARQQSSPASFLCSVPSSSHWVSCFCLRALLK